MSRHGLPPRLVRPALRLFASWALATRLPWPVVRRRVERALRFPGPPRAVAVAAARIGGVPCEVLTPPGAVQGATLLYVHGGGWTFGSVAAYRPLAARLAVALGRRVVTVDYRLTPDWSYQDQRADVAAVWDALEVEAGAGRIVLAGDSAGAHLALLLALALREQHRPLPAALGLLCPCVDMTEEGASARGGGEREPLLSVALMRRCFAAALDGADPHDPAFSPILADLTGLPPIVLDTAADDLLRADGLRLAAAARAAGVRVDHDDLAGLWHVPHQTAHLLGGEAGGCLQRFADRLRALG